MEIRKSRSLIREFKPWMIDALKSHIQQGYSARSFSGYYLIDNFLWGQWLRDIPELKVINEKYKLSVNLKRRAMTEWGMGLEKIEKIVLSQTEIEAASDKLVEVFLENRETVLLKKLLRDSFTVGANWAVCQIQRKQMLVTNDDFNDDEKVADL